MRKNIFIAAGALSLAAMPLMSFESAYAAPDADFKLTSCTYAYYTIDDLSSIVDGSQINVQVITDTEEKVVSPNDDELKRLESGGAVSISLPINWKTADLIISGDKVSGIERDMKNCPMPVQTDGDKKVTKNTSVNADNEQNCSLFKYQEQAQAYYLHDIKSTGKDKSLLDGNKNGLACDMLPKAPKDMKFVYDPNPKEKLPNEKPADNTDKKPAETIAKAVKAAAPGSAGKPVSEKQPEKVAVHSGEAQDSVSWPLVIAGFATLLLGLTPVPTLLRNRKEEVKS